MEDAHTKSQLLFSSQWQTSYYGVRFVGKVHLFKQLFCLIFYLPVLHSIDTAKEADVLHYSHVFVERELLAHIAYMLFNLFVFCGNIETTYRSKIGRASCRERV